MADPITALQTASGTVDALTVLLASLEAFIPKLVMLCAFLAAAFPRPDPASQFYPILKVLHAVVNSIAINIGHARNKGGG